LSAEERGQEGGRVLRNTAGKLQTGLAQSPAVPDHPVEKDRTRNKAEQTLKILIENAEEKHDKREKRNRLKRKMKDE
jgi:hypothetical protein